MPSRSETYRAKAAECEQKARLARDPRVESDYADMARQWRELAEQAAEPDGS